MDFVQTLMKVHELNRIHEAWSFCSNDQESIQNWPQQNQGKLFFLNLDKADNIFRSGSTKPNFFNLKKLNVGSCLKSYRSWAGPYSWPFPLKVHRRGFNVRHVLSEHYNYTLGWQSQTFPTPPPNPYQRTRKNDHYNSFKWTCWVWELTGWRSRLWENYQSFLEEFIEYTLNQYRLTKRCQHVDHNHHNRRSLEAFIVTKST